VNECAPINPCAHICIDKVIGYECLCNPGFKTNPKDSHLCSDIDECVEQKPCSQFCRNTFGSYVCSCADGYIPVNGGHSCKTNSSKNPFLNIFSLSLPSSSNRYINVNSDLFVCLGCEYFFYLKKKAFVIHSILLIIRTKNEFTATFLILLYSQ